MANHYSQASAALGDVTPEEGAWWEHFFVPSDELSPEELEERKKRAELKKHAPR